MPNRPATGTANPGASASTSEPLRGRRREPGDPYGAPSEALRQALDALARLAFWISWTADSDLLSRYPGEHPQHARGGGRAPQGRGRSRSGRRPGRRPCRSSGRGIRPGQLAPTPGRSPADTTGDGRRRSAIAAHTPQRAPPGAGAGPGPGGARDGRRGPPPPHPFHPFHHDIEGDSHESHRPPARTAHPGGSAEPAGACARERAQDAGRSNCRGRDEGLHRRPWPAGEPGRPHGRTGRCRRLGRDRRRTPPRGHEGLGRGRHDRRRPPGALPGRRRSGYGRRAVAGGEHRPHRHASRRPGDRLHEAGRFRPLRRRPSRRASAPPSAWSSSASASATWRRTCSTPTGPTRSTWKC